MRGKALIIFCDLELRAGRKRLRIGVINLGDVLRLGQQTGV